MTARLDLTTPLVVAGLAFTALALGVLAGVNPAFAVGGAFGLAFVVMVFQSLSVGVAFMAFLAFVDTLPTAGSLSLAKLAGLLLAGSWLAVTATRREKQFGSVHPVLTVLLLAFLAWSTLSVAWAEDQGEAVSAMVRYAPNVLLIPIVFAALRKESDVMRIVWVLVAAASLTAIIGILAPPPDPSAGDPARAAGTAGDANELAASLVVGMVLMLALAAMRRYPGPVRLALAGAAGLCLLGIFMSLSRGGLVALVVAAAAAVAVSGRYKGKALVAAALVICMGLVYFTTFASLPARERVTNVSGGTGRTDLWTVAWRMAEDKPLAGVGVGNYPVASIHYLLQPGAIERDDFIISTPKVAHNTSLQVLAETGLPGAFLFLAATFGLLWTFVAAARRFDRDDRLELSLIARALFVAMVGYLTAAFFISANYNKIMWLLLALGPPLLYLARGDRARSSS